MAAQGLGRLGADFVGSGLDQQADARQEEADEMVQLAEPFAERRQVNRQCARGAMEPVE